MNLIFARAPPGLAISYRTFTPISEVAPLLQILIPISAGAPPELAIRFQTLIQISEVAPADVAPVVVATSSKHPNHQV